MLTPEEIKRWETFCSEPHEVNEFYGSDEWYKKMIELFNKKEHTKLTRFENAVQVLMDKSRQGVVDSKTDEDVIQCARRLMEIVDEELPHWKKDKHISTSQLYALDNRGEGEILLLRKGYKINIKELIEKLPEEITNARLH